MILFFSHMYFCTVVKYNFQYFHHSSHHQSFEHQLPTIIMLSSLIIVPPQATSSSFFLLILTSSLKTFTYSTTKHTQLLFFLSTTTLATLTTPITITPPSLTPSSTLTTACECNRVGSIEDQRGDTCNTYTGQCVCKANVLGVKCDQCAPGFWNFMSNRGGWCGGGELVVIEWLDELMGKMLVERVLVDC